MSETVRLLPRLADESPAGLSSLLERRRSIRRLADGPFDAETLARLTDAIQRTPSAYNQPPWHVVIVRDDRGPFWDSVEDGFRSGLSEDRLERYLDRLTGFRSGVGAILVYENRTAVPVLQEAWQLQESQAVAVVQQGIGMVQLSIWLALTESGLVTSLQHWDWLVERPLADFIGVPRDSYKLAAVMPFGYPAEAPRTVERPPLEQIVSLDRFGSPGDHAR